MVKGAIVAIIALVFKEDWYFALKERLGGGQG